VSALVIVCDPFSAIVEMEINQQLKQQINIKFLVKLSKSGPEICQMLQQAYGKDALKKEHCFQVGVVLSRRPKRSYGKQKVRAPFHFGQR
jgi:hypothetical protein